MTRYTPFALVIALAACDPAGLPDPKDPVSAERRAYEIAASANDSTAIALDIATLALHMRVEAEADKRAAACKGTGRELQLCQSTEAKTALEHGQPLADGIDAASRLQLELRELLIDYQKCTPGMADRHCQASALAKAAAKSPEVKVAVEAARKALRNVRPAH